ARPLHRVAATTDGVRRQHKEPRPVPLPGSVVTDGHSLLDERSAALVYAVWARAPCGVRLEGVDTPARGESSGEGIVPDRGTKYCLSLCNKERVWHSRYDMVRFAGYLERRA